MSAGTEHAADRVEDSGHGTVLLTGSYSSQNRGDLAMQLIMGSHLRGLGRQVLASVPFPNSDSGAYEEIGVAVVQSNRRRLVRSTFLLFRMALWRLAGSLDRTRRFLIPDKEAAHFCEASLVVDLSGDMITEDYGPHVTYSHLIPLIMAALTKTPFAIVAQSIGPFKMMRGPAEWALKRAGVITVRDRISLDYVMSLGITSATLTADLAFLLDPAEAPIEEAQLLPDAPFLGVSVSHLIDEIYRREHRGRTHEDFVIALARGLDEFGRRRGMPTVFFPQVTGPGRSKDDRVFSELVRQKMVTESTLVRSDLAPATLKGLISKSTLFLGARMHANIAALSSAVPTVAIAYSHKTQGIMDLLGMGDSVVSVVNFTSESLVERLEDVASRRSALSKQLVENLDRVRSEAELNFAILDRLLSAARTQA